MNIFEKIQIQENLKKKTEKIILLDNDCLKNFTYTNVKNFIFYDVPKDIRDFVRLFSVLEENDNIYFLMNLVEYNTDKEFYDLLSLYSKSFKDI